MKFLKTNFSLEKLYIENNNSTNNELNQNLENLCKRIRLYYLQTFAMFQRL